MSYWLNKKKYDVLIKGGGIAGVSTAYWINKLYPKLSVVIQEPKFIGAGATGRNAGFLTCGSINYYQQLVNKYVPETAAEVWNFYKENHALLKPFLYDCDYEKNGAVTWGTTPDAWNKLQETAKLMDSQDVELVGSRNAFLGGVKYKGDASVNPVKLLKNLLKEVRADIVIEANDSTISAPITIKAMNGYTLDKNIPIEPQRAQAMILDATPRFLDTLGYNTEHLVYFKQLPEGYFLIGGARSIDLKTENTSELGENPKIQQHLYDFTQTYFPELQGIKVKQAWSGIMGFTPDHQPLVGKLTESEYIVAGFSGHGMGMAFNSSKKLVEHIFGGSSLPEFMNPKRFNQEGK